MSRGEGSGEVGYATLLLNNTPKTTHGHKRSQGNFTTRDVYRPYSLDEKLKLRDLEIFLKKKLLFIMNR